MSDGKEAEAEKGKARPNGVVGGSEKKQREDNREEALTVTEDEVKEFFAILRKIHVAVNYFKNGNGDNRNLTGRRSLVMELERTDVAVDGSVKAAHDVKEDVGFDLNAYPEPDLDPV